MTCRFGRTTADAASGGVDGAAAADADVDAAACAARSSSIVFAFGRVARNHIPATTNRPTPTTVSHAGVRGSSGGGGSSWCCSSWLSRGPVWSWEVMSRFDAKRVRACQYGTSRDSKYTRAEPASVRTSESENGNVRVVPATLTVTLPRTGTPGLRPSARVISMM
jgi:hypothetical protein